MALIYTRTHTPQAWGCYPAQSPDLLLTSWSWESLTEPQCVFLICKMGLVIPVSEDCIPFLIIIDLLTAVACSELVM